MIDLSGKVAVITGSSRGIGRAIAEAYARAGAAVVVSSRRAETCEPVAEALRSEGRKAIAIPCHVGRKDDLMALADAAEAAFGKIDILVCNAAVNPHFGPLSTLTDDAFDKVLSANVKGCLWLANRVLPGMAERRDGAVIIISSIGALRASSGLGAYCISKAAEISLVQNLANEWGPSNIRVNGIAPGLIETEFSRKLWEDPEHRSKAEDKAPLRRIGQPEDIAGVALFLASPLAAFVTAQTIVADGGQTSV
jgi:dehydrogenase/reductase SDR family protein 4